MRKLLFLSVVPLAMLACAVGAQDRGQGDKCDPSRISREELLGKSAKELSRMARQIQMILRKHNELMGEDASKARAALDYFHEVKATRFVAEGLKNPGLRTKALKRLQQIGDPTCIPRIVDALEKSLTVHRKEMISGEWTLGRKAFWGQALRTFDILLSEDFTKKGRPLSREETGPLEATAIEKAISKARLLWKRRQQQRNKD